MIALIQRLQVTFTLVILLLTVSPIFGGVALHAAPNSMLPSIIAPSGMAVMRDPSGTYWFYNFNNGTYTTDSATYERLLQDPYARISANVQVSTAGSSIVLTQGKPTNEQLTISFVNESSYNWAGAAGGFCTFTTNTQYGLECSAPTDTMNISQVSTTSLSWNNACWGGGSSCVTGFWTGESGQYSGAGGLVQNGIAICEGSYTSACPNGTNSGGTYWDLWYEDVSPTSKPQYTPTVPTTINSTSYEFEVWWNGTYSANYYWQVGTWSWQTNEANTLEAQTYFVQSEGIFETPNLTWSNGTSFFPQQVIWSPNNDVLTGWYRGAGWWSTAPTGNYGSGYNTVYYVQTDKSSGNQEASGIPNPNNTYTWEIDHT